MQVVISFLALNKGYASHRPKSRFFGILAKINFARLFKDRLHFLEEIIG